MYQVFSTSYFPSISYMKALLAAPAPCIDNKEHFIKQTFRNRCCIYSPNGPQLLTVPVAKGRTPQTPTDTIRIAYDQNWHTRNWRAIEAAYRSSPYFEYYEDDFKPFFTKKFDLLVDYNRDILACILSILNVQKKISYADSYVAISGENNKRNLVAKQADVLAHGTYWQVFQEKHGFIANLSILDLIFCEGPAALVVLQE